MEESFENYCKVYQLLEDEESKDIYLNRLAYLISGDYKYIKNITSLYLPEMPLMDAQIEAFLNMLPQDRDIILYGAGGRGALVFPYIKNDRRFVGFCSNNTQKQKDGYLGCKVISPEELLNKKDFSVLVCAPSARREILELLRQGEYPQEQVFDLDSVSVYTDPKQYFGPDFMSYDDEEVLIDAGCYDLCNSIEMRKYCRCLKKVYAFEPDLRNYKECLEKKQKYNLNEIEIFPYGTWSEKRTLTFSSKGNTSSKVCVGGEDTITVVPIDEVIDFEDRITFIKMDVEGAELESLKGAKRIIQRDRPKLAVCIYHKTEDMVEIPLFIKELVPEYKLYIRLHANNGEETVLYAIPPDRE